MANAKKTVLTVWPPLDGNQIVRRYLDLPKYIELLRTNAIYLQRVDLFPDKLEGVLTPGIRQAIDEAFAAGHSRQSAEKFSELVRQGVYLNCWSLGADDNMALWQLYGSSRLGVVVTSTIKRLIDAACVWGDSERVEIFKVEYIDHLVDPNLTIGKYTDPLKFKHTAYAFEREVRIVVSRIRSRKGRPPGISLPIDLGDLMRSVVVAPEAPDWFFDLVRDVSGKYSVAAPIRRSKLAFIRRGHSTSPSDST